MPRARSRRSSSASLCLDLELREDRARLRRVAFRRALGEPELHRERDELLLGTVVDVALELARSSSCAATIAGARRLAKLLDQPDVAEDESRLRGEVADSRSFDGFIGSFAGIVDRERSEELALVTDLERASAGRSGERRRRQRTRRVGGPRRRESRRAQLAADPSSQTTAARRPGAREDRRPSAAGRPRCEYVSPTRPENSVSTSYGVARPP